MDKDQARRWAELERDRDEWKDATISGNTRFKMAEEKLASEREKTAELERVLDVARDALTLFATPNWAGSGVNEVNAAIATIDAARSKEGG